MKFVRAKSCSIGMALTFMSSAILAGGIGSRFNTIGLPYNASISIPTSWQVLAGGQLDVVETATAAAGELSGYGAEINSTETLIAARNPDPELYASVTITSVEMSKVRPETATQLSEAQLNSAGSMLRTGIESMLSQIESKTWGWTPYRRVRIESRVALHTTYFRSSDAGARKVLMYKFFGTGRIYDMTLSTNAKHQTVNDVILRRIAESLEFR